MSWPFIAIVLLLPGIVAAAEPGSDPETTIRSQLAAGEFVDTDLADPVGWSYEAECPLRLTLALPPQAPRGRWTSTRSRRFRCDRSVSAPLVALVSKLRRQRLEEIQLELYIKVDPPQDKLADIRCELLLDGAAAARGGRSAVEVEEGRSTRVLLPIVFREGELERWSSGVGDARLRLYVSAVDD